MMVVEHKLMGVIKGSDDANSKAFNGGDFFTKLC